MREGMREEVWGTRFGACKDGSVIGLAVGLGAMGTDVLVGLVGLVDLLVPKEKCGHREERNGGSSTIQSVLLAVGAAAVYSSTSAKLD